jgi:hypothetical protein
VTAFLYLLGQADCREAAYEGSGAAKTPRLWQGSEGTLPLRESPRLAFNNAVHKNEHNLLGRHELSFLNMSPLSLFGLFVVTAMLVCYAMEDRSRWFILAFALACSLGSAYGFLQGAWPFGLVEAVWCIVAARRWWRAGHRN